MGDSNTQSVASLRQPGHNSPRTHHTHVRRDQTSATDSHTHQIRPPGTQPLPRTHTYKPVRQEHSHRCGPKLTKPSARKHSHRRGPTLTNHTVRRTHSLSHGPTTQSHCSRRASHSSTQPHSPGGSGMTGRRTLRRQALASLAHGWKRTTPQPYPGDPPCWTDVRSGSLISSVQLVATPPPNS